ncbi:MULTISPECIES: hypothetical protein [Sorangium]|uniref:Uncharacterized protein n=1 Tax=Sorangium cellulosum TaxID=56 RepID=A0A4P2QG51_SORCE|nr:MULTISPECIES: hypothetical protein [Sorangium]AUX28516.1 uncharacterized protein SOCE836_005880 [Sorangium cellulosum]WCQ87910.1 hypothetical protein NQZ70_00575 [Sorangium sp. Soce836]
MRRLPRGSAVVIAVIAAFVLLGFVLLSAPGHDDSHITYWAAHTLEEHGQILNYNGERVEQSSSLAHVLPRDARFPDLPARGDRYGAARRHFPRGQADELQVEHPVIVGVRGAWARDTVARPELLTRDASALRTPAR